MIPAFFGRIVWPDEKSRLLLRLNEEQSREEEKLLERLFVEFCHTARGDYDWNWLGANRTEEKSR